MRRRRAIMIGSTAAWLGFIFARSLRTGFQSGRESKAALSLLQAALPFGMTEHMLRKLAHFSEFGALGFLLACVPWRQGASRPSRWVLASLLGMLAAVCDETLQLFVEGRGSSLIDVWIDSSGAACGAFLALLIGAIIGAAARYFRKDRKS